MKIGMLKLCIPIMGILMSASCTSPTKDSGSRPVRGLPPLGLEIRIIRDTGEADSYPPTDVKLVGNKVVMTKYNGDDAYPKDSRKCTRGWKVKCKKEDRQVYFFPVEGAKKKYAISGEEIVWGEITKRKIGLWGSGGTLYSQRGNRPYSISTWMVDVDVYKCACVCKNKVAGDLFDWFVGEDWYEYEQLETKPYDADYVEVWERSSSYKDDLLEKAKNVAEEAGEVYESLPKE